MWNFFQALDDLLRKAPEASVQDTEAHHHLVGLIDEVETLLERNLGGTRGLLGVGELVLAFEGVCTAVIDAPVSVPQELLDRLATYATDIGADSVVTELSTIVPDDPHRAWMPVNAPASERTTED